jgi:hypothetical protein
MVGKKGYARVDKHGNPRQYANYWCSRAQRSRALCSFYNGHSAPKLERAVLDALAAYADPTKAAARAAAMPAPASTVATELARVSARLGEIEVDFAQNLDLLKRKVIDEDDFKRANATRKDERERLTREQDRLQGQVTQTAAHAAAAATLPGRIQSFTAAVETLPTAQAKALLQGLLVAAHVARDRTVELEFRV